MNDEASSSVAVSFGRRVLKRMTPSWRVHDAGDQHGAENEQRVDEDRSEDRGLRDRRVLGLQGEDDDEELGQVADRRLQRAGDRRPEAHADLLGGERDDPGQAGQRERREDERDDVRDAADVASDAGQDRQRQHQHQDDRARSALSPGSVTRSWVGVAGIYFFTASNSPVSMSRSTVSSIS